VTSKIIQTDTVAPSSPVSVAALARPAGFTLIELIISVAVLAIVIALAVPSLTNLMLDAGLKTTAIDVYNTMAYARSEAIKRNATVDIIPTGGNWKNGWTVQVGATVLKTVGPSTTSMDIKQIPTPGTISYDGTGRLTPPGSVTYELSVSGNPHVTPRRVIVDMSGRATIRRGTS
jgi:type IV fimbrial biogenesis protein FimT